MTGERAGHLTDVIPSTGAGRHLNPLPSSSLPPQLSGSGLLGRLSTMRWRSSAPPSDVTSLPDAPNSSSDSPYGVGSIVDKSPSIRHRAILPVQFLSVTSEAPSLTPTSSPATRPDTASKCFNATLSRSFPSPKSTTSARPRRRRPSPLQLTSVAASTLFSQSAPLARKRPFLPPSRPPVPTLFFIVALAESMWRAGSEAAVEPRVEMDPSGASARIKRGTGSVVLDTRQPRFAHAKRADTANGRVLSKRSARRSVQPSMSKRAVGNPVVRRDFDSLLLKRTVDVAAELEALKTNANEPLPTHLVETIDHAIKVWHTITSKEFKGKSELQTVMTGIKSLLASITLASTHETTTKDTREINQYVSLSPASFTFLVWFSRCCVFLLLTASPSVNRNKIDSGFQMLRSFDCVYGPESRSLHYSPLIHVLLLRSRLSNVWTVFFLPHTRRFSYLCSFASQKTAQ
ncbi:hypothetical protein FISHEDRAFT_70941 [Fistulina hepatica ATCC 64428]|uniref:Uncharacterized protein n=1 Tax=Fistulina hepatica ATCC 64428 TaxID=1128425 RepID=A0A0D7AJ29_9AGAR|nr:hypothetical protein FISHEDRAFT_70941 [Fistulina hepatica ATCC 64428]